LLGAKTQLVTEAIVLNFILNIKDKNYAICVMNFIKIRIQSRTSKPKDPFNGAAKQRATGHRGSYMFALRFFILIKLRSRGKKGKQKQKLQGGNY